MLRTSLFFMILRLINLMSSYSIGARQLTEPGTFHERAVPLGLGLCLFLADGRPDLPFNRKLFSPTSMLRNRHAVKIKKRCVWLFICLTIPA